LEFIVVDTVIITQRGVKLKIKPVPSMLIVDATKRIREPEVPMFHNTQKDRDEPNPADPKYLQALQDYKLQINDITQLAYLGNGVSIIEPLPDDVCPIQDDEWVETVQLVGVDVPSNGAARRIAWLRYYVLSDQDFGDVLKSIAIAGGSVTEEQVAEAEASFRDNKDGTANPEIPVEEQS
jgi:hypothetical protein